MSRQTKTRQRRPRKAASGQSSDDTDAKTMRQIFNDCQRPDKHQTCLQRMNALQTLCSRTKQSAIQYYNELKLNIKFTFVAHDSRSPFGQYCIEFIIKYLLNFRQSVSNGLDEDIEDQRQEFIDSILKDVVIPYTNHIQVSARINAINFIRRLSEEVQEFNEDTYDSIKAALLHRTVDKVVAVRSAAILALHRFQNVSDKNDLTSQAIYYHLCSDPDAEVRQNCLKAMGSSKNSIPYFIDATRDIKDFIRKTAYIQIAQKFDIKCFTIDQRLTILKNGLKDRSLAVRKVVESVLINSWINSMTNTTNQLKPKSCNNLVLLLVSLDIQTDIQLIEKMVDIYFKSLLNEKVSKDSDQSKFEQMVQEFRQYYLTDKQVFKEELTVDRVEEMFLWRFLSEFCKTNKIVSKEPVNRETIDVQNGEDINLTSIDITKETQESESTFDTLVPDVPYFCEYLEGYFQSICSKELSQTDSLDYEFIFKQLMKMSLLLEIGDEAQRKHLIKAIHSILINTNIGDKFQSHIAPLMKTLSKKGFTDNNLYLDLTAEIISEIYTIHTNNSDDNELHEETNRDLENRRNQLIVDIENHKKEVLELETEAKLSEAEELNKKINDLQLEVHSINEKIANNSLAQSSMASQTQDLPSLMDYPNIHIRCLDILSGCLEFGDFAEVNAVLQNLIEIVCLPGFLNENPKIRYMATRCLGLVCFVDHKYFKKYLHFMIEIFSKDAQTVKLIALQSVFDCLCEHGLQTIIGTKNQVEDNSANTEKPELESDDNQKDFVKQLNDFFEQQLESEVTEIRQITVQGISKLLIHSKMYSPELLSRLVIIWFTPDESQVLIQFIGEFLRLYSLAESQGVIIGQNALEEAFVITLQTIHDNSLKLDSERLIKFFLNLINDFNHIKLADKLCRLIIDSSDETQTKLIEDYLLAAISQLKLVEMENKDLKQFENHFKQIQERLENSKSRKVKQRLFQIKNNIELRTQQLKADSVLAKDFGSDDENQDKEGNSDDESLENNFTRIKSRVSDDNNENTREDTLEGERDQTIEENNDNLNKVNESVGEQQDITEDDNDPNIWQLASSNDQDNNEEMEEQIINKDNREENINPEPIEENLNHLSIGSDSEAESYRTCSESPQQKRRRLSPDCERQVSHESIGSDLDVFLNEKESEAVIEIQPTENQMNVEIVAEEVLAEEKEVEERVDEPLELSSI